MEDNHTPDLPPYVATQVEAVHVSAEGTEEEIGIYSNIGDREVVFEIAARQLGMQPEELSEEPRTKLGRLSVGFRRWNSTWDPHADRVPIDPSLN